MKVNRSNPSSPEDARQVLEQLDHCVEKAREFEKATITEKAEAKVKADREAARLDYLTGFGQITLIIADSFGMISGLISQNWLFLLISAAGVINAAIGLYVRHRQE